MSEWDRYGLEAIVLDILAHTPPGEVTRPHLGRPFLTPYQIAIALQERHHEVFAALDKPIGGAGTGEQHTLSQYLGGELSRRMSRGELPQIEGGYLSNQYLDDVLFARGTQLVRSSSTESQYPLSMFRLRLPTQTV